ncbi:hypothetical protein FRZ44_24470 [Hypericibacter terrae]|uniref:DUF2264 domain-containing protein n=1 Tax=Hypericibacter terrae TaxID=2602015 RepID=A0A5J6MIY3_9PROT|nr:hypothetical protein FRZ44_24470 [Hypericibacter terrae]
MRGHRLKKLLQEVAIRSGGQPLRLGAWRRHDRELRRLFSGDAAAEEPAYVWLFRYLLTGFLEWRSSDGSRAAYPGLPSNHGRDIDDIEGFSRFAPLIGSWLAAGRPESVETLDGQRVELPTLLLQGFLSGTDPAAPGYWGLPTRTDQRICEAADIALALWLSRGSVWPRLSEVQRDMIANWLRALAALEVYDNNWHLFPVTILLVLRHFHAEDLPSGGRDHYARLRRFHLGAGWYADGKRQKVDYYNAWGFHYGLFWVRELAPVLDPEFLDKGLRQFAKCYAGLISPAGLPMIGRSIPYRLAIPAPLIAAQRRHPETISPGLARRAMAAVWGRLVPRGAIRAGIVTQGYEGSEPGLLDPYSGPASPLWSLRSLILALYEPSGAAFWTAPLQPLPIEEADYDLDIPSIAWRVEGRRSSGDIVIRRQGELQAGSFEPIGWRERWLDLVGRPKPRRGNYKVRYLRAEYSSARPFWRDQR